MKHDIDAHHANPRRWTLETVEDDSGRVRRRSAVKRKAVLQAARRLAARDGYASVAMEGVAREARVGKQTLYRWWPSKPALFVDVYADLAQRSLLLQPESVAEDRLAAMLARLFRIYRETEAGAVLAGLIGDAAGDPAARQAIADGLVLGRRDLVADLIEDPSVDADSVQDIVIGQVWRALLLDPGRLDDDYAARLAAQARAAGRVAPE